MKEDLEKLCSRVSVVAAGGAIRRYHTFQTIQQQTNAEHQWRVASLMRLFHPTCSMAAIDIALHHDTYELFTGDLPADAKITSPNLKLAAGAVEVGAGYKYELFDYSAATPYERFLINLLDKIEALMFLMRDARMGNLYAKDKINELCTRIEESMSHAPVTGAMKGSEVASYDLLCRFYYQLAEGKIDV